MRLLGFGLPVVTRDVRHHRNLIGGETAQAGMADQIERMLVMALKRHMLSDLVKERRVFEQLPLAGPQLMQLLGLIENAEGERRDVLRVRAIDMTAFSERQY